MARQASCNRAQHPLHAGLQSIYPSKKPRRQVSTALIEVFQACCGRPPKKAIFANYILTVLDHRLLGHTGGSGTLGGSIGHLELEVRQTFDFQDAAKKDVLLALEQKCVMASETRIAIITA